MNDSFRDFFGFAAWLPFMENCYIYRTYMANLIIMKAKTLNGFLLRGALLGGLLGIFSSSLSAQEKYPVENDLKIISYNIHHGEGLDGKTDYVRIGRLLREHQADVVALQEVDSVTGRSQKKDVLREIAAEALMYPIFAKAIPFDGGSYGIGLLAREHPLSVKRIALPGREEARVLLLAEFADYYIGCTHLSLTPEDQLASLNVIRDVASRLDKPFLLAGDWNAVPGSRMIQEIQKDFTLLNSLKQATYPADKPDSVIDYIALWKATGRSVVRKGGTVLPDTVSSDHRPVMAKVRFLQRADRLFYAEPYLQNPSENGITVMFQTRVMAHCWVEYGTDTLNLKRASALRDGQAVCHDIENKIRLSGLKGGTPYYYRVCAREIGDYQSYSKVFGDTVRSSFYRFCLPASGQKDFTAIVLNDMHVYGRLENKLSEKLDSIPHDFVVFNGDCLPEPADRDEAMENINRLARLFHGSSCPLFFVRGNHEIRNAYSAGMSSLFDNPGGNTYGAFSWGDTRFIVLDCGEDKPDDHWVYYGLNDFSAFREDQAVFLKKELQSRAFLQASCRILINHIPLWGNEDDYVPCQKLWGPILQHAPIDLNLSAHTHHFAYYPKGKVGNPFPVYVGGGYKLDEATCGILQRKGETLTFTVVNLDGKILLKQIFDVKH